MPTKSVITPQHDEESDSSRAPSAKTTKPQKKLKQLNVDTTLEENEDELGPSPTQRKKLELEKQLLAASNNMELDYLPYNHNKRTFENITSQSSTDLEPNETTDEGSTTSQVENTSETVVEQNDTSDYENQEDKQEDPHSDVYHRLQAARAKAAKVHQRILDDEATIAAEAEEAAAAAERRKANLKRIRDAHHKLSMQKAQLPSYSNENKESYDEEYDPDEDNDEDDEYNENDYVDEEEQEDKTTDENDNINGGYGDNAREAKESELDEITRKELEEEEQYARMHAAMEASQENQAYYPDQNSVRGKVTEDEVSQGHFAGTPSEECGDDDSDKAVVHEHDKIEGVAMDVTHHNATYPTAGTDTGTGTEGQQQATPPGAQSNSNNNAEQQSAPRNSTSTVPNDKDEDDDLFSGGLKDNSKTSNSPNSKKTRKQKRKERRQKKLQNRNNKSTPAPTAKPSSPPPVQNTNPTSEECDNTVNSDQTTHHMSAEEAQAIIGPKAVRYQFTTELKKKELKELEALAHGSTNKADIQNVAQTETYMALRMDVLNLFTKMRSLDEYSLFVSWEDGAFTLLNPASVEDFPLAPDELKPYISGIITKKEEGKVYLKVRIHSMHEDEDVFETSLVLWAQASGYSMSRCIIQAANMRPVGWFVYTNQYTDRDQLKAFFEANSSFEWGFKVGPVTDADARVAYNKRVKAVCAFVPEGKEEEAKIIAKKLFRGAKEGTRAFQKKVYWTTKMIFMLPQADTEAIPVAAKTKYFKEMIENQKDHLYTLAAQETVHITADLDEPLYFPNGEWTSLRDMILHIKSFRASPFKGSPLFQAVDFCSNLSNVWINGYKSSGGQGHIFSFFRFHAGEARAMIKGLGIYLAYHFGDEIAADLFSTEHWIENDGWEWDDKAKVFNTPDAEIIADNRAFNPYKGILAEMKKYEDEENKKKKEAANPEPPQAVDNTNNTTTQTPSGTNTSEQPRQPDVTQILADRTKQIMEKAQTNEEDDHTDPNLAPGLKRLQFSDDHSVASSLTLNTGNSHEKHEVTADNLHTLFKGHMTFEEKEKILERKFLHEENKRKLEQQRLRELLRKSLKHPPPSPTPTPSPAQEKTSTSPSPTAGSPPKSSSPKQPSPSKRNHHRSQMPPSHNQGRGCGRGRGSGQSRSPSHKHNNHKNHKQSHRKRSPKKAVQGVIIPPKNNSINNNKNTNDSNNSNNKVSSSPKTGDQK